MNFFPNTTASTLLACIKEVSTYIGKKGSVLYLRGVISFIAILKSTTVNLLKRLGLKLSELTKASLLTNISILKVHVCVVGKIIYRYQERRV